MTTNVHLQLVDSTSSNTREHGLYQIGISSLQTDNGALEIDLSWEKEGPPQILFTEVQVNPDEDIGQLQELSVSISDPLELATAFEDLARFLRARHTALNHGRTLRRI